MVAPAVDMLDSPDAGPAAIRGGGLRTAGYVAGVLLMLAAAPLLVRHLGVVDFGRYTLVVSLIALVGGLTEGGLTAVGLREYSVREGAERDVLMRNLLGVRLTLTLLGVAGAIGFALLAGYDRTLLLGTLLAGVGLLLFSVQNLLTISLAAGLRFGWLTGADLLRTGAQVVMIVAFVMAGGSLVWFLATPVPAGLLALVLVIVLVRRVVPIRPAFHPRVWRPLLEDMIPYSAAVAVNVMYFRTTIILMSLIATAAQTGYFSASYRIIEVLLAIPWLVVSAAFPVLSRAARNDATRFAYVTGRIFEVAVILGGWMALCVELAARFIIDVLAGGEFGPSVAVLRIQALAVIATFIATGCGFALLSLRRHLALLVPNVLALAFSVTLTLVLVPAHGERGAAIAAVAAEAALAAATTILLVRSRRDLRLPLGVLPAVAVAAAAGAATALVPGLHEVVRVGMATAVYFGLLTLLGRMPPEVRNAFAASRLLARGPA